MIKPAAGLYLSLCVALGGALATGAARADDALGHPVTPVDVINAMESHGVHAGVRRNHAKGLCVAGEFKPTREAAALSASNIFAGAPVKVVGRFSNAGPDPASPDNATNVRGFALQFQPQGGATSNMSMLNVPVFPVPDPEGFYTLLTLKPDQMASFQAKYPRSLPFFQFLGANGAPVSYATEDYHSLSAFKFTNGQGQAAFVRWNFVSEQGNHFLTPDAAKAKSAGYLSDELQAEIAKGPLRWTMQAVLAQGTDSLVDPSMPWVGPHKTVTVGTLTLNKADVDDKGACNGINFDPTNVAAGIEPSDDPVLKFRSPAYAISYGKRLGEKAQAQN